MKEGCGCQSIHGSKSRIGGDSIQGYMVIRNVVPRLTVNNVVREIADPQADLYDSTTWYRNAPENDGIILMHHVKSLWDIRQCPTLDQVFAIGVATNVCPTSIKTWKRGWSGTRVHAILISSTRGSTTAGQYKSGMAGDVVLWSTKLPHGSAANLSNRPGIAAFVSMQPAADSAELRADEAGARL
jgi:hypothetical protein